MCYPICQIGRTIYRSYDYLSNRSPDWMVDPDIRSIRGSSEQSIWCRDPNRLPNILRSYGSSDSQINCVHIGTTDRPNVQLIRRTTIPRLSIDLNRFNQIGQSEGFFSGSEFIQIRWTNLSGARSDRSDSSIILERYNFIYWYPVQNEYHQPDQIDRMDLVIHWIRLFIHCSFIFL